MGEDVVVFGAALGLVDDDRTTGFIPPLPPSCGRHGGGELPSFVEEMENVGCRAGEEQGVQLSGHQRDAEIPKDRIGDMPLTIALQGKLPVAVRWELAGQEVAS